MKILKLNQIRSQMFETNSSSCHTLVISFNDYKYIDVSILRELPEKTSSLEDKLNVLVSVYRFLSKDNIKKFHHGIEKLKLIIGDIYVDDSYYSLNITDELADVVTNLIENGGVEFEENYISTYDFLTLDEIQLVKL